MDSQSIRAVLVDSQTLSRSVAKTLDRAIAEPDDPHEVTAALWVCAVALRADAERLEQLERDLMVADRA